MNGKRNARRMMARDHPFVGSQSSSSDRLRMQHGAASRGRDVETVPAREMGATIVAWPVYQ